MDNELIVNSIKQLCKNNGITVSFMEKEIGMSQGLVSKWAKTTPSLDKIIDIADYFHETIDDVIGRTLDKEDANDMLIEKLSALTINDSLIWLDTSDVKYSSSLENYELFDLIRDYAEIFEANYKKDSSFIVVIQYNMNAGSMEDISCFLYVRPDINSLPVLIVDNTSTLYKLWLLIHTKLKGTPDEYKAEKVIQDFLEDYFLQSNHEEDDIPDENNSQYCLNIKYKKLLSLTNDTEEQLNEVRQKIKIIDELCDNLKRQL